MMAAPVLSLAATGLSAGSSLMGAQGQAKGDEFEAQKAEENAQYGRIAAAQTGEAMTRNMTKMLGHLAAIRASAGADIRSPTTAALMANQEGIGERDRAIKMGNIFAQVRSDQQASSMYTDMASRALMGGYLGAAGSLIGGLGGAFKSMGNPGFSGGGGSMPDLIPSPSPYGEMPLDTSRAPQPRVSGGAIAASYGEEARGLEKLGAGAEQLATPIAEAQAASDLQNQKVMLGPDGKVQVLNPARSFIFGRAGEAYGQTVAAGTAAQIGNLVNEKVTDIHAQHLGDPQGQQTATNAFIAGFKGATGNPVVDEMVQRHAAAVFNAASRQQCRIHGSGQPRQ